MKKLSGTIMLLGAAMTVIALVVASSAIQEAASAVFVIGAYVTGRALENFSKE